MQRSREIALSLAGAREYIERYMENKKSTLKENEKAGFYQLITFINTIEAQSGWKENDSLSNYWKEVEKSKLDKEIKLPPLNQVQIRKDALSRELKTYEFSNRQVQTLYNQINNEMPIFNNHSILKQQVNAALSAVMTGLNPDWKSVNNNQSKNIPLPKSTIRRIDLYQTQFKEHYDLCTTLQGSYIPFNQAADPLIGKAHDANTVEGYCRGHTRIWANKIADHGRFDSLQRVTSATTRLQRDQEITVEHGRSYTQLIDIPECIQDVFGTNIRENVTYGIDLAHAGDINKHIIGFRKIPLTGQIEIFDANIGLFIFPDMDAFKIWFSHVFSTIYVSPYGGGISLEILGPQKENAKASIPPTIESSSIEFKYSDTLKLDTSRSAINFERITLKLNTFAHIALRDKKIEIKEELLSHQMIQFAEAMRRIFLH
ncbi:MAG: hypothetical protein JO131_10400, partial [Gammaproteobacteria bacterium]|nr:hypothetical protein [Gammaproteobacteria bacterium]